MGQDDISVTWQVLASISLLMHPMSLTIVTQW